MNDLISYVLNNDKFPILFSFKDFEKIGYSKDIYDTYLSQALEEKYIDRVYGDIYTLDVKHSKKIIPQGELAQMIIPDSYVSLYYVLWDYDWIPEMIFAVTSVTRSEDCLIDTNGYGTYIYTKVYSDFPTAGIYTSHSNLNDTYKTAKPLRALCDLIYFMKKEWTSVDPLYEDLRIDTSSLEETLTGEDFDELQGAFGIKSIENFLRGVRKDLAL